MKNIILIVALATVHFYANAQFPSMTFAHSGISPSNTLTVNVGDSITFIYGSGGTHPMTSGQGGTLSPVFFPTITVSASIPSKNFALSESGTYIFHCGTNPNNSNLWGTIIVNAPNNIEQTDFQKFEIWPTQTEQFLHFNLSTPNGITVYNIQGQSMMNTTVQTGLPLDVSHLPAGMYVIRSSKYSESKTFIKK